MTRLTLAFVGAQNRYHDVIGDFSGLTSTITLVWADGTVLTGSSNVAPASAAGVILGVICLTYLYVRDRRRVTEVGLVHLDDELEQG